MNPLTNIKNVQKMNERELELGLIGKKSWHDQYKDSAWVFIGGLPYDLTEGDVIAVFSQYGELVNINLVRDGKTGKSRGFCFLCYEDQRSTVLAVDNLNGIKLLGRTIRVDHVEKYKVPKEHEDEDEMTKRLRMEGIAPKMEEEEGEDSASEEDYLIPLKKHKKDKKAKKKKKKMKTKKHKEKHESESEDSDDQSPKSKILHSEKQTKEKRPPQWTEWGNERIRDYETRDRSPERCRESVRARDIRHSPDRIRNDRYRDRSPRDRDYSPRRRDRDSPKRPGQSSSDRRDRNQDYSPKIRYRDPSPRRRNKDSSSPQRRDKFPRDRYRDGDRDRRR